ncbi:hypothetical protein PMAYCL1PPCAC_16569, partial [Pristionchus mayeri]
LYMLILALLADAEKGEFSGFRRFIHRKIDRFFHWQAHKKPSLSFVNANASEKAYTKAVLSHRPSRSANSSPTFGRRLDDGSSCYKEVETRRITISVNVEGELCYY